MSEENKTEKNAAEEPAPPAAKQKVSTMSVISSTLAAGLGVQSEKNRERDFAGGNVTAFVVSGVIFTLILVIGMIIFVNAVVLP